ncbi:tetratricopeptide repeat protein [Pantanalinema sp. GBBB05]|uniref:tetratricopeptide repeat protein n=1 Tax=Pantanalinema sp. GBBB05 TaxID=2604139 RepID=UPI001D4E3672|nr:tetratricopeptide repeat protein [Pantanalinema sp. GBBB05]
MKRRSTVAQETTNSESNDLQVLIAQGLKFAESEQYAEAIASYEQAIQLQPQNPNARYHRAEVLANLGKYEQALAGFDQVIQLQPNHAAAWVFRAVMLIYLHRYQEALDSCDRVLTIQPDHPEAWTFRGVSLYYLGRYELAYASYNRATGTPQRSLWQRLMQGLSRLFRWLKRQLSQNRSSIVDR